MAQDNVLQIASDEIEVGEAQTRAWAKKLSPRIDEILGIQARYERSSGVRVTEVAARPNPDARG